MRSAGKTAIVVPEDLIYGLSRMFEVYAEEHASGAQSWKTFRDIEDATAWLGFGKGPECLSTAGHNYGNVSTGGASRLAALLVGQMLPAFFLLAPGDPGASPPEYVTVIMTGST